MLNKSDLHNAQEVPVETSVDDEDKDLGNLVPYSVNVDEGLTGGRNSVGRDPDAENSNVDGSDDNDGTPFDVADSVSMLGNKGDTVDDNLHEQLNFEDPEEKDEE